MRQILTCLILIGLLCTGDLYATDNGKKETIRRLRQEFAKHISGTPVTNYTLAESLSLIDADGRFTDKRPEEEIIIRNNYAAGTNMAHCIQINNLTRVWVQGKRISSWKQTAYPFLLLRMFPFCSRINPI